MGKGWARLSGDTNKPVLMGPFFGEKVSQGWFSHAGVVSLFWKAEHVEQWAE